MINLTRILLACCIFTLVACDAADTSEVDGEITDLASSQSPDANGAGEEPVSETDDEVSAAEEKPDEQKVSVDVEEVEGEQSFGVARAQQWYEPKDRTAFELDFNMIDQNGQTFNLKQLNGKPTAVSFMFTNCKAVNMCPALTSNMAALESRLVKNNLADAINLALISYDPKRDSPEALMNFGKARGVTFDAIRMLSPEIESQEEFMYEWSQTQVSYLPGGDIAHYLDLYLIDKQGRLARIYTGGHWSNELVMADLMKLMAEPDQGEQPETKKTLEDLPDVPVE